MGMLYIDGFEEYNTLSELEGLDIIEPNQTINVSISSSQAKTGSQSLYFVSSNQLTMHISPYSINEVYMGAAYYLTSIANGGTTLTAARTLFVSGSHSSTYVASTGIDGGVIYNTNGTIIIKDSTGTTRDTSAVVLAEDTWFYIETYFKRHSTAGEITVRVNGSVVASASGIDTLYYTASSYSYYAAIALSYAYVDDLYLATDGFKGPLVVKTFVPDADGTYTQFTRNTGSNDWEMLDETNPDSDTTYVEGDTQGQKHTSGITTSGVTGPIRAVEVRNWVKGVGDGPTKIKALVRSNSTDYEDSTEHLISESYTPYRKLYEVDPDDSNVWTSSKLDSAEFGVTISSLSTTTTV